MKPILTAVQGTNADLFPFALALYSKPGDKVLDMTYGLGVFWKNVTEEYLVTKNDIDAERGNFHEDFRHMSFEDQAFDAVVLDPPYASRSGSGIKASIDRGYNNHKKAFELGIIGNEKTMQFYRDGMNEAFRVLVSRGMLYLKCMDEIMGGKQKRNHITLWNYALEIGFIDEDLFVLMQNGTPTMRHTYQFHARKNNSFLWVFRKAQKERETK